MDVSYRGAAVTLWGEAGAYAHDAYDRWRHLYPELPAQVPIVIGITAYGHCVGLTDTHWEHGPRITIASERFKHGRRWVDDVMVHEMLHAWLHETGQDTKHAGKDWYAAIRRLSPDVLGFELDIRRGVQRKSVRKPNPAYDPKNPDSDEPKTIVRKVPVDGTTPHKLVAGWPRTFRPHGYDWGEPIYCPTY